MASALARATSRHRLVDDRALAERAGKVWRPSLLSVIMSLSLRRASLLISAFCHLVFGLPGSLSRYNLPEKNSRYDEARAYRCRSIGE